VAVWDVAGGGFAKAIQMACNKKQGKIMPAQ
jgi:hypothetical protein